VEYLVWIDSPDARTQIERKKEMLQG